MPEESVSSLLDKWVKLDMYAGKVPHTQQGEQANEDRDDKGFHRLGLEVLWLVVAVKGRTS